MMNPSDLSGIGVCLFIAGVIGAMKPRLGFAMLIVGGLLAMVDACDRNSMLCLGWPH